MWLKRAHELIYISLFFQCSYRTSLLEIGYDNIERVRLQCSYWRWTTTTYDWIPARHIIVSRRIGIFGLLFLEGSDSASCKWCVTLCGTILSRVCIVIVSQILSGMYYIIFRWYSLIRRTLFNLTMKFILFIFLLRIVMSWSQSRMISLLSSRCLLINSVSFLFGWGTCPSVFFYGSLFINLLTSVLVRFSSCHGRLLINSLWGTIIFHFL